MSDRDRSSLFLWLLIVCLLVLIGVALTGCTTPAPVVVTKTVTQTVDVPGPMQTVPSELSADCPPAPLVGTTLAQLVDRLESVETALAQCRLQLGKIRGLK